MSDNFVGKSIRWRCDSLLLLTGEWRQVTMGIHWLITEQSLKCRNHMISYHHSTHHLPVYIHLLRDICVPPLSGFDLWAQRPRDRRFQLLYSLMYLLSGQQGTIPQSYLTSFQMKPGPFPEISPHGVWTNGRLVEKLILSIILYTAHYSPCKGHLSQGDHLIFLLHHHLSSLNKAGPNRQENQS